MWFSIVDLERYTLFTLVCTNKELNRLKDNFEFTKKYSRCEFKMEFESMKMKGSEDTELFIHNIEKFSMSMKEDLRMIIVDDDIISIFLKSLTTSYDLLVDSIQIQINIQTEISLDSIK